MENLPPESIRKTQQLQLPPKPVVKPPPPLSTPSAAAMAEEQEKLVPPALTVVNKVALPTIEAQQAVAAQAPPPLVPLSPNLEEATPSPRSPRAAPSPLLPRAETRPSLPSSRRTFRKDLRSALTLPTNDSQHRASITSQRLPIGARVTNSFRTLFRYEDRVEQFNGQGTAATLLLAEADALLQKLNIAGSSLSEFAFQATPDHVSAIGQNIASIGSLRAELESASRQLRDLLDTIDLSRQNPSLHGPVALNKQVEEKIALLEGLEAVEKDARSDAQSVLIGQLIAHPDTAGKLFIEESRRLYVKRALGKPIPPQGILNVASLLDRISLGQMLAEHGETPQDARKKAKVAIARAMATDGFERARDEFNLAREQLMEETLGDSLFSKRAEALGGNNTVSFAIERRFALLHALANDPQFINNYLNGPSIEKQLAHSIQSLPKRTPGSSAYSLYQEAVETEHALLTAISQTTLTPEQKIQLKVRLADLYGLDSDHTLGGLTAPLNSALRKELTALFQSDAHQREILWRGTEVRSLLQTLAGTEGEKVAIGAIFQAEQNRWIRGDLLRVLARSGRAQGMTNVDDRQFFYELFSLQASGKLTPLALETKTRRSPKLEPGRKAVFNALLKPLAIEAFKGEYGEEVALAYAIDQKHTLSEFLQKLTRLNVQSKADPSRTQAFLAEIITQELDAAKRAHYLGAHQLEVVRKRSLEIATAATLFSDDQKGFATLCPDALKGLNQERVEAIAGSSLAKQLLVETQGLSGAARTQRVAEVTAGYIHAVAVGAKLQRSAQSSLKALIFLDEELLNAIPQFAGIAPQEWSPIAAHVLPRAKQIREELAGATMPQISPITDSKQAQPKDGESDQAFADGLAVQRERLVQEIKETEESFGESIAQLNAWGQNGELRRLLIWTSKSYSETPLDMQEMEFAFQQIARLEQAIQPFQGKLARASNEVEVISLFQSDAFREYAQATAHYASQCDRISKAMKQILECLKTPAETDIQSTEQTGGTIGRVKSRVLSRDFFSQEAEALKWLIGQAKDDKGLFADQIITPVQRLGRHLLLAKEILKHTAPDSALYAQAAQGYALIKGSVHAANGLTAEMNGLTK